MQRIRAQARQHGRSLSSGDGCTRGGAPEIGPTVVRDQSDAHCAYRRGRAVVRIIVRHSGAFPFTDAPRGADAGRTREGTVAAETPRPVKTQVDVEEKIVVKPEKELLSVGSGVNQDVPGEELRARREPALRAGNFQTPAPKDVLELAGQPVDRMPLRHYSTISPVVSYTAIFPMRRTWRSSLLKGSCRKASMSSVASSTVC